MKNKRKKRPTAAEAEATFYAVVQMLKAYPLLSYTDAAKAAGLSKQRIGQIAMQEPGLEAWRDEQKEILIKKLGGRIVP